MAGHGSAWITSQVTSQQVSGWQAPASASMPLDSNFESQPTRESGFKSLSISGGGLRRRGRLRSLLASYQLLFVEFEGGDDVY